MKTIITDIPEREEFECGLKTLEIGYPWITPGAIMALEMILDSNFEVLEIGSGGSTVFYANRCYSVVSIESSLEWFGKVRARLDELQLENCESFLVGDTLAAIKVVNDYCYHQFDLVAVDPNPSQIDRYAITDVVMERVKPGGWLLLDNYVAGTFNRDVAALLRNGVFEHLDFWESFTYDDLKWSGKGTRLYRKPL